MKSDKSTSDRLLEELLREDARGGADEEFLQELQSAMAQEEEGKPIEKKSSAPLYWKTAAVAACAGLGIFLAQSLSRKQLDQAREAEFSLAGGTRAMKVEEMKATPLSISPEEALVTEEELIQKVDLESAHLTLQKHMVELADLDAQRQEHVALHIAATKDERASLQRADFFREQVNRAKEAGQPTIRFAEQAQEASDVARGLRTKINSIESKIAAINLEEEESKRAIQELREKLTPTSRNTERYGRLVDQPWKSPWKEALSTFSVDVDTASYANIRRLLRSGSPCPCSCGSGSRWRLLRP